MNLGMVPIWQDNRPMRHGGFGIPPRQWAAWAAAAVTQRTGRTLSPGTVTVIQAAREPEPESLSHPKTLAVMMEPMHFQSKTRTNLNA